MDNTPGGPKVVTSQLITSCIICCLLDIIATFFLLVLGQDSLHYLSHPDHLQNSFGSVLCIFSIWIFSCLTIIRATQILHRTHHNQQSTKATDLTIAIISAVLALLCFIALFFLSI